MRKFGWDLPPGCSMNDIPGNKAEDLALESAEEKLLDDLNELSLYLEDYNLLSKIAGIIIPMIHEYVADMNHRASDAHSEYMEWLKCEIGGMMAEIENDERYKERQFGYDQAHGKVLGYKRILKLLGEKVQEGT